MHKFQAAESWLRRNAPPKALKGYYYAVNTKRDVWIVCEVGNWRSFGYHDFPGEVWVTTQDVLLCEIGTEIQWILLGAKSC